MTQIEHLLRKRIGLDSQAVGSASIERAVWRRMEGLGLARLEDYQRLLEESRAEWNQLVESVVVTETWFFRDPLVFSALARLVLEEWLPTHPAGPLRLLSVPCASGEEPYSLVMALLDAGVASDRIHVEAVDISTSALARAERAVYGKNSFRGKDRTFCNRYFQPAQEGFVLDSAVRHRVHFYRGNLFSNDLLPRHAVYDFIFCRHLLIYFDRPAQRRAVRRIERLLAPSGVLFVGPAEQPIVLHAGFVSANIPEASACRRADRAVLRPRLARLPKRTPSQAGLSPYDVVQPRHLESAGLELPRSDRPTPTAQSDLETARRLADAGRLQEAAEICEANLRQSQVSAQAHFLLGRVRDASGDARAIDSYRKALYLNPDHYESLAQMARLMQMNGDSLRARAFQDRAQRVRTKA